MGDPEPQNSCPRCGHPAEVTITAAWIVTYCPHCRCSTTTLSGAEVLRKAMMRVLAKGGEGAARG